MPGGGLAPAKWHCPVADVRFFQKKESGTRLQDYEFSAMDQLPLNSTEHPGAFCGYDTH